MKQNDPCHAPQAYPNVRSTRVKTRLGISFQLRYGPLMSVTCYFCKRERSESQCETCKRWVCIECSSNHDCYERQG
jgi:hypothetical protein